MKGSPQINVRATVSSSGWNEARHSLSRLERDRRRRGQVEAALAFIALIGMFGFGVLAGWVAKEVFAH
jgi:hypothetical protein